MRHWEPEFFAALRARGDVRFACRVAMIDRSWVYDLRRKSDRFAAQWESAIAEHATARRKRRERRLAYQLSVA